MKVLQKAEADRGLEQLRESCKAAVYRLHHYRKLTADFAVQEPKVGGEFVPSAIAILPPPLFLISSFRELRSPFILSFNSASFFRQSGPSFDRRNGMTLNGVLA